MRKMKSSLRIAIVFLLGISVFCLSSCAALRKKFTRKPKKKEKVIEDVVFTPVEYPEVTYSNEEVYASQYLLWKNWQNELINVLYEDASRKRQISSTDHSLEHLGLMKNLLNVEKQEELGRYIQELSEIRDELANSRFITISSMKRRTISIKNKIQKNFSYNSAKDYIE